MTQNKISTNSAEEFLAKMTAHHNITNDKSLITVMTADDVMKANMAPKVVVAEPRKEQTFKLK